MRRTGAAGILIVTSLVAARVAHAQEPPPRIGPFVVDFRLAVVPFGGDDKLAESRSLNQAELPGSGFGLGGGAHFYFPKVAGVTVGIGGEGLVAKSHSQPPSPAPDQPTALRPVTERFTTASPYVSLNFGSGNGWSYLSVGISRGKWSIVPDGAEPLPADEASRRVIGYGGGARWFFRKHLAVSLDVRLYEIDGTAPQGASPGSPRTLLLAISGGIAIK